MSAFERYKDQRIKESILVWMTIASLQFFSIMLVRYEDDLLLHLHESSLYKATAAAVVVAAQVIGERGRRKLKRRRMTRKWSPQLLH